MVTINISSILITSVIFDGIDILNLRVKFTNIRNFNISYLERYIIMIVVINVLRNIPANIMLNMKKLSSAELI